MNEEAPHVVRLAGLVWMMSTLLVVSCTTSTVNSVSPLLRRQRWLRPAVVGTPASKGRVRERTACAGVAVRVRRISPAAKAAPPLKPTSRMVGRPERSRRARPGTRPWSRRGTPGLDARYPIGEPGESTALGDRCTHGDIARSRGKEISQGDDVGFVRTSAVEQNDERLGLGVTVPGDDR